MKIIGVDLDDTLLDSYGAFVNFHNDHYGTSHKWEDISTFFIEDIWGITTDDVHRRFEQFYKTDYHRDAKVIDGAIEAITELAKHNKLHILTASPGDMKEEIETWLKKHFEDKFSSIHFMKKNIFDSRRSKKDVCKELGIEVFIDDALHNAEDIAAGGIPVYLLDNPWNQGETGPLIKRVHSWKEVLKDLEAGV
ncbi:hypothetical protein KW807_02635 [Candidatus Parcubacteria bacterium]|nr:hypothetical protein [Candidatus Parcubacteria bacterium]